MKYDVIVIGGGPAGMAAALSARENGAERVAIIERDKELGGILNQCIHNGFGLHHFKEELTGPEYAGRFARQVRESDIDVFCDTMVLNVSRSREVYCVSRQDGCRVLEAGAVVLAMGCRERTRGAIAIPGQRCSGVFTAGTAQRYVNMEGWMVGKRVVILGSGDIGLIMARRMTLEGAKVLACVEICPYSNGLIRNVVQCLEDYGIPLMLSHTITEIKGKNRVEGVVVSQVDASMKPIPGTEQEIECDTVLLSVGLIPENELTQAAGIALDRRTRGAAVYENNETEIPGIFACGNVLHVHDLVDFVTAESIRAGKFAAQYAKGSASAGKAICVCPGEGVSYTVPQKIRTENIDKTIQVFFRVRRMYRQSEIVVERGGEKLCSYKREHMAPGEMESIALPAVLLRQEPGEDISIRIVEKEVQAG